jgi:hypothetical protein
VQATVLHDHEQGVLVLEAPAYPIEKKPPSFVE